MQALERKESSEILMEDGSLRSEHPVIQKATKDILGCGFESDEKHMFARAGLLSQNLVQFK